MRYEALKKVSDEMLARKDELGRLLARELQPAKRGKKISKAPANFCWNAHGTSYALLSKDGLPS